MRFCAICELVFRSTESNYNLWDFPTPPLIGSTKIGLDQLRHGVYIQIKDGFFRKMWRLCLRYRNPFRFFKHSQTIRKIRWHSRFSLFEIIDSSGNQYFSNTLNLAAGAIVNTKLLLGMIQDSERLPLQASLSDHLCTSLGKVTIDDLVSKFYLKKPLKLYPFIFDLIYWQLTGFVRRLRLLSFVCPPVDY